MIIAMAPCQNAPTGLRTSRMMELAQATSSVCMRQLVRQWFHPGKGTLLMGSWPNVTKLLTDATWWYPAEARVLAQMVTARRRYLKFTSYAVSEEPWPRSCKHMTGQYIVHRHRP